MLTKEELEIKASEMRNKPTYHEALFIMKLDEIGVKYKFQYIVGCFIVDFLIKKRNLVIEIDGKHHNDRIDYDEMRTKYLKSRGLNVYRIPNKLVKDFDLKKIGFGGRVKNKRKKAVVSNFVMKYKSRGERRRLASEIGPSTAVPIIFRPDLAKPGTQESGSH